MFKKFTLIAAMLFACYVQAEDASSGVNVLLWWFDDPVITDFDGSTYHAADLPGRGAAEGLTPNLVRVSATTEDGTMVYLNLGETPDSCEWAGAMVPTLSEPPEWRAGPWYADITELVKGASLSETSIMFALELGHITVKDDGSFDWIIMASANETLQALVAGGHIISSELSVQGSEHWSPAMNVPEPSSGLLVLIGGALLALRRRRKDVAA